MHITYNGVCLLLLCFFVFFVESKETHENIANKQTTIE